MAADLRALLDPLKVIRAARAKYAQIPGSTWSPPATEDTPHPTPVVMPPRTDVFVDPADLPAAVLADGKVDLGAQLALVQAALAQFGDLRIRTITGFKTLAPLQSLIWATGVPQDIELLWSSTPVAPVQGAVARLDASIAATGRVTGVVVDDSVTDKGCTVRCTAVGAGPVTISTALPLTVTAVGLYLYWPPYQGGS